MMHSVLPLQPFRRILGACLVAAPLAMLVCDVVGVLRIEQLKTFSSVAMWFSFVFFTAGTFAIAALVGESTPKLATAGAALTVMGALTGASIMGLTRMAWSMENHGLDQDTIRAVIMDPAVHLTSRVPGICFPIGLILLAIALRRTEILSTRSAVVLGVGAFLFPVGRIVFGAAVNTVSDVLMAAVLVPLGLRLAKTRGVDAT